MLIQRSGARREEKLSDSIFCSGNIVKQSAERRCLLKKLNIFDFNESECFCMFAPLIVIPDNEVGDSA